MRLLSKPEKNEHQSSYLEGPTESYQKKKEKGERKREREISAFLSEKPSLPQKANAN